MTPEDYLQASEGNKEKKRREREMTYILPSVAPRPVKIGSRQSRVVLNDQVHK